MAIRPIDYFERSTQGVTFTHQPSNGECLTGIRRFRGETGPEGNLSGDAVMAL